MAPVPGSAEASTPPLELGLRLIQSPQQCQRATAHLRQAGHGITDGEGNVALSTQSVPEELPESGKFTLPPDEGMLGYAQTL